MRGDIFCLAQIEPFQIIVASENDIRCSVAGRGKSCFFGGGGLVAISRIICPPPVGIGLTDLPNIGEGASAPLPPVPASLR